ncbi:MAG: BamA/TamA family outer membrane protein [Acidobacteria bacterium]|nr:BamA/TamA family outer membrane protein [Acidobacteriota bacterium]
MPGRLLQQMACLALLAVVWPSPSGAGAWQQNRPAPELPHFLGKPIRTIEVTTGTEQEETAHTTLRSIIGLQPGQPLELTRVREAIIRLYESGRASQVVVEARPDGEGVDLIFRITPQARIRSVSFVGLEEELQSVLLRRLSEIDPGSRLSAGLLDRTSEQIVEYLHGLGFFQAEATPAVTLDPNLRQADVTFTISKGDQTLIEAIDFSGSLALPEEDLLKKFDTKPNLPFDQSKLQADIDRIRDYHLQHDYLAPSIGAPNVINDAERRSVRITIPVDSGSRVHVVVEGFSVPAKTLRKILPIYRQGGLDPATLEEGRLNLQEEVQRRGYFFAELSPATSQLAADGSMRVSYRVDPGRRHKLARIKIQGIEPGSVAEIRPRLASIEGGWFSRGVTSRDLMYLDEQAIVAYLKSMGYRRAVVRESRTALTVAGEDLVIIYVVDPGALTRIAAIEFEGAKEIPVDQLGSAAELEVGEPYSDSRLNAAVARISRLYSRGGFDESQINSELREIDEARVGVVFRIEEGPRIRIQRVLVRGEAKTREASIRKFLTFHQGELLDREKLMESEQDLLSSGAFQRVTIRKQESAVTATADGVRNVIVDVATAQRYQIGYGGGFRTDDGPRGLFEFSNNNLWGRLYTGGIRMRASRREQIGQISVSNPRPFGWALPVLVSTFYQRQQEVGFDARRLSAVLQVEKRLSPLSQLLFRYSFSNVLITNVTDPGSLERQDETARIGRLSVSYLRDARNALFDSTAGDFTSFDFSVASAALIGDENFVRFYGEHQRFYPLTRLPLTVLALDARLGLTQPFGRSKVIPISERFFAGGSTTLRGFGFEEAGPRVLSPDEPGQTRPSGGNALVVLNAELRFPIWDKLRLGGALFYDAGNVFAQINDVSIRKFTHTVGFGLRIRTPVGPIRIDFGYLLRREPLVPRSRTHITFGPPF